MIQTEDSDKLCQCKHPGYEHGLWMGEVRLREIEKKRKVGCRVVGCECEGWNLTVENRWDIGEG
jgi:hypothetical protein